MVTYGQLVDTFYAFIAAKGEAGVIGDAPEQNLMANDVNDYLYTMQVTGTGYMTMGYGEPNPLYTVALRCMYPSKYMIDSVVEQSILIDTELRLNELFSTFACKFTVRTANKQIIQNEYDAPKSGWQITVTLYEE